MQLCIKLFELCLVNSEYLINVDAIIIIFWLLSQCCTDPENGITFFTSQHLLNVSYMSGTEN